MHFGRPSRFRKGRDMCGRRVMWVVLALVLFAGVVLASLTLFAEPFPDKPVPHLDSVDPMDRLYAWLFPSAFRMKLDGVDWMQASGPVLSADHRMHTHSKIARARGRSFESIFEERPESPAVVICGHPKRCVCVALSIPFNHACVCSGTTTLGLQPQAKFPEMWATHN